MVGSLGEIQIRSMVANLQRVRHEPISRRIALAHAQFMYVYDAILNGTDHIRQLWGDGGVIPTAQYRAPEPPGICRQGQMDRQR